MPVIRVTPEQLVADLRRLRKDTPEILEKGIRAAARRGQAHMPGKTPTDMGQLRNSWRIHDLPGGGMKLENDAPHAGIVEMGARPHKVNRDGIEALTEWAMRKFGMDAKAARGMAFAIAKRLEKEGQKPTYFTRNELETLAGFVPAEVEREIAKATRGRR